MEMGKEALPNANAQQQPKRRDTEMKVIVPAGSGCPVTSNAVQAALVAAANSLRAAKPPGG